MGRASSRKKLRRDAGYTARRLRDVRRVVELTERMGGMMRLTVASDGELIHHALVEIGSSPKLLCATTAETLSPSENEVTCLECIEIPERAIQEIAYKVNVANRVITERNRQMLKVLGG